MNDWMARNKWWFGPVLLVGVVAVLWLATRIT